MESAKERTACSLREWSQLPWARPSPHSSHSTSGDMGTVKTIFGQQGPSCCLGSDTEPGARPARLTSQTSAHSSSFSRWPSQGVLSPFFFFLTNNDLFILETESSCLPATHLTEGVHQLQCSLIPSHMLGTPLGAEQAHIDACPPGAALCQECEALILTHV